MATSPVESRVDVVVVAYNSAGQLRGCIAPLAGMAGVTVIVVDNASPDDTAAEIAGLPVALIRAGRNGGFAAGCNLGIATGCAPYVLLLNPDARLPPTDLDVLAGVLDRSPTAGIAVPLILEFDGSVAPSLRRFPRRRSTFAQALFLHRLWPNATWADELVRDADAYVRPGSPEWASGACMLVRRDALELVGGLDEGFFLYCEDTDLCRRIRAAGFDIRFDPRARAVHEGGGSAPRVQLQSVLARSRVRYARKHGSADGVGLETLGVGLGHLVRVLTSLTRPAPLRAHLHALGASLRAPRTPADSTPSREGAA